MIAWALWVAVNCSEPRLQFVPFFEKINYGLKYPGMNHESLSYVTRRALDTLAAYADYTEAYRDDCGAKNR